MKDQKYSTKEQFSKLKEFRQRMYKEVLKKEKDAQFEIVEALLLSGKKGSYVELSQSPVFGRCWSSVYQVDLLHKKLEVIVGDGHYGNHQFLGGLKGLECARLVRLRKDRVLYGSPPPYRGHGRPPIHGKRFAFKEAQTWGQADEEVEFEHEKWGQVQLRRFNKLHAKQDAEINFDVILAEVHLERDKPPSPLWLGYVTGHTDYPLETVWSWYDYRWPIEPSIRFRKQTLQLTLPRFQDADTCDRWLNLVDFAYWQLFLARPLVQDNPLPWQKPQTALTPYRVKQGLAPIFCQIGTPALPPKTRGKSPGWPPGRPRTKPKQFKAIKRAKK